MRYQSHALVFHYTYPITEYVAPCPPGLHSIVTLTAGNILFSKGKYNAAADCYTEAITLDPTLAVLYVNRGMCYKKTGRWQQVAQDGLTALTHNRDLMKAHYLVGVAHTELSDLPTAISHLSKALEAAREQGDSIKDEIWRELAKAKYAAWQQESKQRAEAEAAVKQQLESLLKMQRMQSCVANVTGNGIVGDKLAMEQQHQQVQQQFESVLQVRVVSSSMAWQCRQQASSQ